MPTRSYDRLKEFHGKRYTGMAVGRSHKWRYDAGEWKERKVTPDRWEISYAVKKHRAGRAPEGSGAPVGTAYHWYIIADQVVTKLDANTYMTEMSGHKLKLSHRRAGKTAWSASEKARRKQLVKLLRELADDLEARPIEEQSEPAKPERETAARRPAHRPSRAPRPRSARHAPAHRARTKSSPRAAARRR